MGAVRRRCTLTTAGTVVAGALLGVPASGHLVAAAEPPEAAAPGGTKVAMLSLHGAGSPQPPSADTRFQVLVEPALGRVQVSDDPIFEDVFLHVSVGHLKDGVCEPELTVVLDGEEWPVDGVYDAQGAPVADVEQFPEVAEPGDVARLAVAPFDAVDCVDAAGYTGADPADPGELLVTSRGPEPLSAATVLPAAATATLDLADWPDPAPYDGQVTAAARYTMAGSWAPDAFRTPSTASSLRFDVEPGPDANGVGPLSVERTDVDLWREPSGTFEFTVDLDPEAVHFVEQPRVVLTIDGTVAESEPRLVPVSHPAPTDWEGTLAGQTWWRPTSYTIKDSKHVGFAVVRFLDDEWAYLEGWKHGFDGEAPETCSAVQKVGIGCHRYYYDEATGQLQLDDLRAEPVVDPDGWLIPTANGLGWEPLRYLPTDAQLPVETGQRFRFRGTGNGIVANHVKPGSLVLRPDGSYRLEVRGQTTHKGRYKFLGGQRQALRLDPKGPRRPRTSPVQLYFSEVDGRQRLNGLESDWFSVLRGGF